MIFSLQRGKEKSYPCAKKNRLERAQYAFSEHQEPVTRSLELPHIPVTALSQTELFLFRIYLEFRFPRELQ